MSASYYECNYCKKLSNEYPEVISVIRRPSATPERTQLCKVCFAVATTPLKSEKTLGFGKGPERIGRAV